MEPVPGGDRRQQYRTMLVIGAILFVGWVLWSVRGSLFPFAVGLLIAYLLAPFVYRVESLMPRRGFWLKVRRDVAILSVYLGAALLLTGAALTIVPNLIDETVELINNIPTYWTNAQDEFQYWRDWYERELPPEVQEQIEQNLDSLSEFLATAVEYVASYTIGTARRFVGVIVGLLVLPLWIYYLLRSERNARVAFLRLWPEELREDIYQIARIIDRILASYVRGQLFLGLVVGLASGIGFWIIGVQQPLALGVVAGILELVPILGPWLTFVIAALVVLATDPDKILWVAGLCLAIQQLENSFLVPRIQGSAVQMNPAVIMVLLVVGGALWGFLGVIIIVPLAAIARDVFVYIYRRLSAPPGTPKGELPLEPGDESLREWRHDLEQP
jgi:predicted PurR-regulated permease PerM